MGKNNKNKNKAKKAQAAAAASQEPESVEQASTQTTEQGPTQETATPDTETTQQEATVPTSASQSKRNKKNKKKNQAASQEPAQQEVQEVPAEEQVRKTPEERAQEYANQQSEMYEKILDSFKEDQQALDAPFDWTEKQNELNSGLKRDETKKLEKQVRKTVNEWDDLYNGGPGLRKNQKGLQTLGDKINKLMKDGLAKSIKKHSQAINARDQQLLSRDAYDKELQSTIKKRKTLEMLCSSIFKKNHDLYLQHETMLDDERAKRAALAEEFQKKMAEVTEEINELKETRTKEVEKNRDVRLKIQAQVDEYRKAEEHYQKQMATHQAKMGVIETKFKGELDTRIGSIIKKAEEEKAKYDKACSNVSELSDQIKTFMAKFETLKEEITQSSAKFSDFQMDTDTRKAEIMTLETQISAMQQTILKKKQTEQRIAEDRARIEKQIKTMSGLKKALTLQAATAGK